MDSAIMLTIVTAGNPSHFEHRIVFIVSVILFLFFVAITLYYKRSPVQRLGERFR